MLFSACLGSLAAHYHPTQDQAMIQRHEDHEERQEAIRFGVAQVPRQSHLRRGSNPGVLLPVWFAQALNLTTILSRDIEKVNENGPFHAFTRIPTFTNGSLRRAGE